MNDYLKELFIDEVKNLGKGGSGGAASWNDLTDRPFGVETEAVELYSNDLIYGTMYNASTFYIRSFTNINLNAGNKYIIRMKEQEFVVVAEEGVIGSDNIVKIGTELTSQYSINASDYPFALYTTASGRTTLIWDKSLCIDVSARNTSIAIYEAQETVKPLDLKFLPDTVATKAYVEELIGGIENGTY